MDGRNTSVGQLHCFSIQKWFVKSSANRNYQFREDGGLFSLCSNSLSPSLNNILLYKTIQPMCDFVAVLKIYTSVPTCILEPPIFLLQCVLRDTAPLIAVSQLPYVDWQQIQSTAFFSFRLSDLVGIFSPLCLDFFPVVPLPLFFSLQTCPMLFFCADCRNTHLSVALVEPFMLFSLYHPSNQIFRPIILFSFIILLPQLQ